MKIGRNEPCPCGSGKKYKKCCANKTEEQKLAEAVVYATHNIKNEARIKRCLHPNHDECDERIVRAHAIQNNRILTKIADNGDVITLDGVSNYIFQDAEKKGRKIATIFNGFCAYHDKVLFQEIEDKEFVCSSKQIFLLTYRTMSWHYHKKQEQINATHIQTHKMLEKGFNMTASEEYRNFLSMLELGNNDNEKEKKIFDHLLLNDQYDGIHYWVWEIPYEVQFAISMMHELEYDILGNQINDMIDDKDIKSIYLNIFPAQGKSYCIWSWRKEHDEVFENFIKQFSGLSCKDRENYFNNNLPRWSDSLVISPRLWNKWGKAIQEGLISHANFDVIYRMMENEDNFHNYVYMDTPWNLFDPTS